MQEPLKILTITIGILHFVQEPLIKILTITIGILHFMQEPLIIKILTITIGILHFMQEPLKILTITIGILHFVQEPLIIKKILTITIGILHFVQEPLIKAASSIKRGSCFEGTRVCFYGVGQPWFIGDSETHRKWTTGSQKHTHTHMFNCFFDNYWSRESRE